MQSKYMQDIRKLEDIAVTQGNRLNLSIILITLKCEAKDISEIIDYFSEKGIEVVNEDVEVESENIVPEGNDIDDIVTPFDPSKIDIKMDKITVDSIVKRIKNQELEFDSAFQRKCGLWSTKQKSQLIESMLLKIPLPAFYFDASDDDKWQIIDGLQRIGTIRDFVVYQKFALTGMEFLKDFNGCKFDQLPRALQRRIEETNLNAYLVNPSTPKNVKFNIFKRINTGGLVLESQEIRNALYQGQATQFLLELSKMACFKKATDGSVKVDRMLDREFCLRYVAFTQLDIEKYNGNLDDFLGMAMEFLSKATQEQLVQIKKGFQSTMENCFDLFGKFAFRRLNTESRRGPVNKALFEVWSKTILNLNREEVNLLIKEKQRVIQKFTALCNTYEFQNAIRAGDKTSVKNRFKMVLSVVNEIIYGGDNNND